MAEVVAAEVSLPAVNRLTRVSLLPFGPLVRFWPCNERLASQLS